MIPSTVERVPLNTCEESNERIRRRTEENIRCTVAHGAGGIDRRLAELDEEWDIERMLETNAATAMLVGVSLTAVFGRKFLVLPAIVGGFLLQHAIQGWCPPVPVLRRLGFRTQSEIDYERYTLKAMRGDFRKLATGNEIAETPVSTALAVVRG